MNSRKLIFVPRRNFPLPGSLQAPHRGFSIIELMMSIVLLAIGMALALPSYREMVEKRQITYGAEQLTAFLNAAQSESIKRNEMLTVSYQRTANNNWCAGATLGAAACDCTEVNTTAADYCAIDSVPWVMNNTHAGDHELVTVMNGDGAYTFDPVRGLMTNLNDTVEIEMRSNSDAYRLNLTVAATGQVTLCSDSDSHRVPGFKVCPAPVADQEGA